MPSLLKSPDVMDPMSGNEGARRCGVWRKGLRRGGQTARSIAKEDSKRVRSHPINSG